VDKARSREQGGTGLGLAIVKHIVEAHRGHVSVKGTLGQGSDFCVTLPL
jgi:two-component system phosphate regulon sensor histidine kinase PhoR